MSSAWRLAILVLMLGAIDLAPAEAFSHGLTNDERTALTQRLDAFVAASREGRADTIVDVVPPPMLAYIASQRHVSVEALHQSMVAVISKIETSGVIASFDVDLAAARFETLADGTPYVLIPTDTVLNVAGEKIRKHTDTLALMDGGAWYFVRINTPALVHRLVEVYPHFAGVDFGGETTTAVP